MKINVSVNNNVCKTYLDMKNLKHTGDKCFWDTDRIGTEVH